MGDKHPRRCFRLPRFGRVRSTKSDALTGKLKGNGHHYVWFDALWDRASMP